MDAWQRNAIKRYLIAVMVFAALICAFVGMYYVAILLMMMTVPVDRFFVWILTEGAKDTKPLSRSQED